MKPAVCALLVLAADVVPRLETRSATKWFTTAERADIVWVGSWAGYATMGPTYATISSTHPGTPGWEAVETAFHEYSHILVDGLSRKLNAALGDRVKQYEGRVTMDAAIANTVAALQAPK